MSQSTRAVTAIIAGFRRTTTRSWLLAQIFKVEFTSWVLVGGSGGLVAACGG